MLTASHFTSPTARGKLVNQESLRVAAEDWTSVAVPLPHSSKHIQYKAQNKHNAMSAELV